MTLENAFGRRLPRRTILAAVAASGLTLALAACRYEGIDPDDEVLATESDDDGEPDSAQDDAGDIDSGDEDPDVEENPDDDSSEGSESATGEIDAVVIVDDVIDFMLSPEGRWEGPFGSVTMRLHRGWIDGDDVTFIRTDASDEDFANQEGLVHVPLMANALDEPGSHSEIYLFDGGPEAQIPVMSSSPADGDNYSSAFRVHRVLVTGKISDPLTSRQAILDAAERGDLDVEETDVIVNYPVITWPGGQMPVDNDKVEALGGGQLIEEPDIEGGHVTLKLHQCYPGSRYIITDTSALAMAPMMGAGEAGGSQLLISAGAVAPITIFLNGLEGTGAMGFQPGVFNTNAGDPAWSPFWEHFAAEWVNEEDAVAVTSQAQLDGLVSEGNLTLYGGVPDTDPDTFVVNCSVPILAPVTWQPPE